MTKVNTQQTAAPQADVVDYSKELEGLTTMAAKIRKLLSLGLSRGKVAKILDIKYQWVRNVEITPLKK